MNEEKIKEKLFQDGLGHYSANDYFEAHESWEDLWSDHYLEDRKFVQGLIQLSVSFVHLENGNMTGAKNLLRKSKEKFELYSGVQRGINLKLLLNQIEAIGIAYNEIKQPIDFDWTLVPNLE